MTPPRTIPLVVVSGFLGSGKTTLVRALLDDARKTGARLAVVSNEFGELGIDAALLADPDDEYVEIQGGCVCCRLSDELVATLEKLRERARPDRIVVETSGLALPYDVQLHLWRDPVARWIGDDVAVVVVNAEQVAEGRDLDATFEQQVSAADLLVLNKTDLVPAAALPRIEAALRAAEPEAPILRAVRADVPPALLFPPDPEGARARRRDAPAAPAHDHAPYETEEWTVEPGVDPAALAARLAAEGALRAKGFVETPEGVRVVQAVGRRVELVPPRSDPPGGLLGRLVVIRRSGGA